MTKIDRVSDLPEWFALERYQGCESFGAGEWLSQLTLRRYVLSNHPDFAPWEYEPRFTEDAISTWRQVVAPYVKRMQRDPLNSEDYFGRLDSYLASRKRQLVKPLLVSDLAWQAGRDIEAEKDGGTTTGIGKRWRSIRTDDIPDAEFMDYANTPVILRNYGYYGDHAIRLPAITVNLSASDDLLLKAFSDWLKEARSSQQPDIQKPRKPLYDRWTRYGLLPYLDLRIWALDTRTHIPINVMADAVGYAKGESSFSKTVVPLANSLIRDLSTLEALAVAEAEAKASPDAETFED